MVFTIRFLSNSHKPFCFHPTDHVELNFDTGKARVLNSRYQTFPSVIHGNGPSKLYLDHLGNYIANSWSFSEGCISCKEDAYSLVDIKVKYSV